MSPAAYGAHVHSSSEEEVSPASTSQVGTSQVAQEEMADVSEDEGYMIEAKAVLKRWRNLKVDWRKEFPAAELPPAPQPLECVAMIRTLSNCMPVQPIWFVASQYGGRSDEPPHRRSVQEDHQL